MPRVERTAARAVAPIPAWAWAGLCVLLAARIAILIATPMQLYPDEAQYWGWAQEPAWGYYSKPPLIAWLIALTTGVFGDAEWAVRLSAPLCHAGAAAVLALAARDLYGRAAGVLAGGIWLSMPAVGLSSLVISTDAPLMLLWSCMLLALARLRARSSWSWAAVLGLSLGFGLLAKYAMAYAAFGLVLAAALDARTRAALLSRHGALAALVCAAAAAPNLVWNAMNGMATIAHTADNADWGESLVHPDEMIEFWVAQLGVFGLVLFPLLIGAIPLGFMGRIGGRDGAMLAAFATPPLVIVSVQAFLAHAYANWAVAAYPAGAVLCAGLMMRTSMTARGRTVLITLALGANVAFSTVLAAAFLSPRATDAMGLANSFKQTRGWEEISAAVLQTAHDDGYATVAFDDRFVFHAVEYYGRDRLNGVDLTMWRRFETPSGHAETCCALRAGSAEPILLVSQFLPYDPWFEADFGKLRPAGEIATPLGPRIERRLRLFSAADYEPVTPRGGEVPPAE